MTARSILSHPLVLSLSKDEPRRSWFDKLTTSGNMSVWQG
jgi:hypothetical protein